MAMNLGNHVSLIKEEDFERVISDPAFRERVRGAYFAEDASEFAIMIETVGTKLPGTFTAVAIVQLTNQRWVKRITERSVGHLC